MEFFSDSPLDDLVDELPAWLRASDPTSELHKWLAALAGQHADLDATAEQLYADLSLDTASIPGMLAEWAYVYDLRPDLSSGALTNDQVRAYVASWVACNGSAQSLTNLLLAIINLDPRNQLYGPFATFGAAGTATTFDAGGAGLTFPVSGLGIALDDGSGAGINFPADGSGITLYQLNTPPNVVGGLVFPGDGSGFTFPDPAVYFPEDGSGLLLDLTWPTFTPLTFPSGAAWVTVTEDFAHYGLTVTIKSWLAFDRGTVRRALDRFRQAHCSPTVYVESPT